MNFKTRRFKPLIAILLLSIAQVSLASNILVGDDYFVEKKYDLATKAYLAAADIGNPRAYYQLGVMHYQGLGTKVDNFKALIWFSLALEQNYENSAEFIEQLLANVAPEKKEQTLALVKSFQASYGKAKVNAKYYPELVTKNISNKIQFGDNEGLEGSDFFVDENIETELSITDSLNDSSFEDSLTDNDFSGENEAVDSNVNFKDMTSSNSFNRLLDGPYFLIADYDIAPDGSIRNIIPIRTIGVPKDAIYNLSMSPLPKPKFNDKGVHFVNRSYLGVAGYDKFRIRRDHQNLYYRIKKRKSKYSKSKLPQDIYRHAMLLMSFPWLAEEEGEADKLLKSAAEQGHTVAKYEYGLKLYREQKDIKEAIYWLSEATKQGNSLAQYRLARILLDSPWVINDETKALFWLEQATEQKHRHAKLKLVEMKLLAKDEALHDVDSALLYLNELSDDYETNPQYHYLQAMAHVKMQPRQLSKAVTYIREAIDRGEDFNWDVTPWQQQLQKWTTGGGVTIREL